MYLVVLIRVCILIVFCDDLSFLLTAADHLEKLNVALNPADDLPSVLTSLALPNLRYLNLRKAKVSPSTISQLAPCVGKGGIDTLVLDGIKLAGSNALKSILGIL